MAIQGTPNGTYGAKIPRVTVLRKLFALYVRMHVRSYRRSGGADRMTRMWDFPVVLLTTKGARSGLERISALGGFPDGDDAWLVVASMAGMAHHPAWFFNMVRNPDDLLLEVGKRKVKVRGQSLLGAERRAALKRIAAISPRYGKYQARTDREIPIVRLTVAPEKISVEE
jgi:deazaflavin-dependent oxidoreductase (nitroreductase family)